MQNKRERKRRCEPSPWRWSGRVYRGSSMGGGDQVWSHSRWGRPSCSVNLSSTQTRQKMPAVVGVVFRAVNETFLRSKFFRWIVSYCFFLSLSLCLVDADAQHRLNFLILLLPLEIAEGQPPSSAHMFVSLWPTHRFQLNQLSVSHL